MSAISQLELIDHESVAWERVRRAAYVVHQRLRYEYEGPIDDLRHQLIIFPPGQHGDQRRILHNLDVTGAPFERIDRQDEFGNRMVDIFVPRVGRSIDFESWILVERVAGSKYVGMPASWLSDPRVLEPSSLTMPDVAILRAAAELMEAGGSLHELASRINRWVCGALRYEHDATDVKTTAAQALDLGKGVCQDYAHLMLAVARACSLPARYVSGHLLGEGGTHAWVEVLLPDDSGSGCQAIPFDPTHGREAHLGYVTIAVGREYWDVAPTSGTFRASYPGTLSARKKVGITEVDYLPAIAS